MLRLLSLLCSLAFSQNNPNAQLPITNLQSPQGQQAVQQALNNKFSVNGGTVSGNINFSTPTAGIQFGDGTVLYSTSSLVTTPSSVFSTLQLTSGPVTLGSSSGPQEFCEITHWYKSMDGAVSQSSGTAYTLQPVGSGLTAYFVATTTTTGQNNAIVNLSVPCTAGQMCNFCVKGNVYVNNITNGCNAAQATVSLAANSRGNITAAATNTFGQIGWCLTASSAGAAAWIRLGL